MNEPYEYNHATLGVSGRTLVVMRWPLRKQQKGKLERALIECEKANIEGYKDAEFYIKGVQSSVEKAARIIEDCVKNMKKHHIQDPNIIDSVKKQLETVQTEFEQSLFHTQADLLTKRKLSSKFNITLFGKTMSGKSTLMEILTHGDGSHMGDGHPRTTRDVRSYDWKGMKVTDVPGIAAYGGQEDDVLAEDAATFADLILFMITAGQPESTEADWMVKLKRMDKPMICICNFKQSIGTHPDNIRLKRFLDNPKKVEERMNIRELVDQFNLFLKEHLPNEHVDFIVTHLLAKLYSQQPEYKKYQKQLETSSQFDKVESAIIDEVLTNGVLHRKRSYLSIIDSSIYTQMNMLYRFSEEAYSQYRIIQDKIKTFEKWCNHFNETQKSLIQSQIKLEFDKLRNSVPGFVEEHLEHSNLKDLWLKHCEEFKIDKNINQIADSIRSQLESKEKEIFSELENEMNFSLSFSKNTSLGNYQFTNWKRVWRWTGSIGGALLGIAGIISGSGLLGIAALGFKLLFDSFSWLSGSRESKLRKRRKKLSEKLNESINDSEQKKTKEIITWFNRNIETNQCEVINKLWLISKSMLSLANGERKLALGYSNNHTRITKKIVSNVLSAINVPDEEIKRIKTAARVPGRRLTLVIDGHENLPFALRELSNRIQHEYVTVIKLDKKKPVETQLYYLIKCHKVCDSPELRVLKVDDGKQTIAYLKNTGFNQEQLDSIDTIQQLLNIHINLN